MSLKGLCKMKKKGFILRKCLRRKAGREQPDIKGEAGQAQDNPNCKGERPQRRCLRIREESA